MQKVLDALTLLILAGMMGILVLSGWVGWRIYSSPVPVVGPPDSQVLRRLEIRLHQPLDPNPDKGQRGDRYRVFECREVPLGSPKEKP